MRGPLRNPPCAPYAWAVKSPRPLRQPHLRCRLSDAVKAHNVQCWHKAFMLQLPNAVYSGCSRNVLVVRRVQIRCREPSGRPQLLPRLPAEPHPSRPAGLGDLKDLHEVVLFERDLCLVGFPRGVVVTRDSRLAGRLLCLCFLRRTSLPRAGPGAAAPGGGRRWLRGGGRLRSSLLAPCCRSPLRRAPRQGRGLCGRSCGAAAVLRAAAGGRAPEVGLDGATLADVLLIRGKVANPRARHAALALHTLRVLPEGVFEVVRVVHAPYLQVVPHSREELHRPDFARVCLVHGHDVSLPQLRGALGLWALDERNRPVPGHALLHLGHLVPDPIVEAGVAEEMGAAGNHRPDYHEGA
mmetsp:Transcript_23397/g.66706  ORF Transcript_23397/g.66706 Transcript_23397/m.66706 type:complete len:353 (-) Transcript_23397:1284-2342(-)